MKQNRGARPTSALRVPVLVLLTTITISVWSLQQVYSMQRVLAAWRTNHLVDAGHVAHSAGDSEDMLSTLDAIDELNRQAPPPPALTNAVCHTMPHTELNGEIVLRGSVNLKTSSWACCRACTLSQACNVWAWCGAEDGCTGRKVNECWLKKASLSYLLWQMKQANEASPWTSGATFSPEALQQLEAKEQARLQLLQNDQQLPLVYLDIAIKDERMGRVVVALFMREAPRAAENFRRLCTGERGNATAGQDGSTLPLHFKGTPFYRIIGRFVDQAGMDTESALGGRFKDDAGGLALQHDRKGLLSMANAGPDTNTAHFSILMGPAPHLDGHYTIFGEVVGGHEVVDKVNALALGKPNNQAGREAGAVIVESGQLRLGTLQYQG